MFQSSRIASGNPRLQTSSAFSPSSASVIWKFRPSRMRRATFRMTLESSTTRHVLILGLYFPIPEGNVSTGKPVYACTVTNSCAASWAAFLCSLCVGHQFEHTVDVEDDHELAVEAVDAAGELGHPRIEIDGIFLAAVVGQPQHLADLVDQEAVGLAAQIDADRHRRLAVIGLRQPETGAHADN